MKEMWNEFRNWVKYVREYKDNKDNDFIYDNNIVALQQEIEELKAQIDDSKALNDERARLMKLREDKLQIVSNSLSEAKLQLRTKTNVIEILNAQLDDAEEVIKEKNLTIKQLNMRYAQSQRKMKTLEKDIQRKDHKIKFLLASREAPSKEKVMAYEKRMREVEKRQKEKAK